MHVCIDRKKTCYRNDSRAECFMHIMHKTLGSLSHFSSFSFNWKGYVSTHVSNYTFPVCSTHIHTHTHMHMHTFSKALISLAPTQLQFLLQLFLNTFRQCFFNVIRRLTVNPLANISAIIHVDWSMMMWCECQLLILETDKNLKINEYVLYVIIIIIFCFLTRKWMFLCLKPDAIVFLLCKRFHPDQLWPSKPTDKGFPAVANPLFFWFGTDLASDMICLNLPLLADLYNSLLSKLITIIFWLV